METQPAISAPALRPWPMGLPLLHSIKRDPLGAMERLHAGQGDIAHLHILSAHVYYLFRPELVRQVLVDRQDDFVKEERVLEIFQSVHGHNVITTEGAVWERQRRMLAPAFSMRYVEACTALMVAAADEGIERELPMRAGETALVDMDRLTTRITMDVILRALFSHRVSGDESASVSRSVRALSNQVMREFFWPLRPRLGMPYPGRAEKRRHLSVLRRLIEPQLQQRRNAVNSAAEEPSDMLALFLAARDAQAEPAQAALSNEEIYANCVGLFGAGHDTSATALAWWIGLMAMHPQIAARVRDEISVQPQERVPSRSGVVRNTLLNATLNEAMRLYPPTAATFSRRALRDVRIGEMVIGRNALVVVPIWSLHRDSRWFPEPETFRPERFMPDAPSIPRGAFMPFGVGPHFCLGQQFAMLEMALIAARLIRHYDLSLEADATLPTPVVDLVLKPATPLRVRFVRRG